MARGIHLAQVNNKYGQNKVFLPYSTGLLQAHAKAQPELKDAYEFARSIFLRGNPRDIAKSMNDPDVLGLSCYIWNWEWSKALAREVKDQHPDSLIVMGGPQVPNRSEGFFEKQPYVDILVHGEGEVIFSNILKQRLQSSPEYQEIPGITLNQGGVSLRTPKRLRLTQEEFGPSPYLTGEFEDILQDNPDLEFHAISETHRGCPFSCSFCDWGSAVFRKVLPFPDERVMAEYDWMSEHEIGMIYNADANFLLFPRDEGLTNYLISLNEKTGFPQQLRTNWAKNTHERIFRTAQRLNRAGMDLGVTLSLQSLDPLTLKNIKRKNIKFNNFSDLVKKYADAGIPTYNEMIMALPGETYETYTRGLETLLEGGQHKGINIYLCTLLPNSEMSHPEYMERHGIQFVNSKTLQTHSTPQKDSIQEYSRMVVGTDSTPLPDFRKTFLFSWAVQTFHSQGLTQDIAIYLKENGISYRSFYEELLSADPNTLIGQQVVRANECLDRGLNGGEWGESDPRYGEIVWALEERSFLDIATGDLSLFYAQIKERMNGLFIPIVPDEIIQRQMLRIRTPDEFGGDVQEYAKKIVWFGRKTGATLKNLQELVTS